MPQEAEPLDQDLELKKIIIPRLQVDCNNWLNKAVVINHPECRHEAEYFKLVSNILNHGSIKRDRTGTGTLDLFGAGQMVFDLSDGSLPLLTTKSVPFTSQVLTELLWMLSGDTNIRTLILQKCHIWSEWPYKAYLKKMGLPIPENKNGDEWKDGLMEFEQLIIDDELFAAEHGDLGPVYGKQWRKWDTFVYSHPGPMNRHHFYFKGNPIDQMAQVIEMMQKNPDSRRIIVSAWNPADIEQMAIAGLPPCHSFMQFDVTNGYLSCQLYQRSADMFLGVPFNIASYAALVHILARAANLKPGRFIWTGGSCHIYLNHLEPFKTQLARDPYPTSFLEFAENAPTDPFALKKKDFKLIGYDGKHHPAIKAPVAVWNTF